MKRYIYLINLMLLPLSFGYSQGCSDAGICSLGSSFHNDIPSKNTIEFGNIFGAGEADIKYYSSYLAYTRKFSNQFALSAKITYSVASGSFGKRGQFGDAYLTANYDWKSKRTWKWSTLVGMKFPFTQSNLKINDYSLPLDYQASLGTFDLIAGVTLNYKNWDFNSALQLPVFNRNRNSYFKEYSGSNDFPTTNLFERRPDILFRTTYTYKTKSKFTFKPNVLFLYHLGQDSAENYYGVREDISGSEGLTINGNLIGSYAINSKNSIDISLATPFVVRTIRPDGLTRSFTAGIIYKVSF